MTQSAENVSFYGRRGGTGLAGVTLGALLALGVGSGCSKSTVQDGGVVVPDGGGNAASLFDKTYIDIQYREHDEVLTVIDTALLKAVQNEPLRNELNTTRTAVQDHRDMAKTLRDRIGTP